MRLFILASFAVLAACNPQPSQPKPEPRATAAVPLDPVTEVTPAPGASAAPRFIAADLVRQQWAKAENRERCAAVAFTDVGGGTGTARPANFSGGWAVAFDQPGLRSAYGVAGPGLLKTDGPPYAQARELARQWPYFMELGHLERPSFAGYGVEGAQRYPAGNADGAGLNSLAYVRIHRQHCTYNVWSRLGRAHLEVLLGGLRLLPPE